MTYTRRILLSLAAVYVLCGWAMAFLPDTSRAAGLLDLVLGVPTMIAVYVWCRAEARRPLTALQACAVFRSATKASTRASSSEGKKPSAMSWR